MDGTKPAAGDNIAVLRRARGIGQEALAARAGVSVSLLRKIERGHRAATPPVVAAIARALGVSTGRLNGSPYTDPVELETQLNSLRGAVRRHTLPREDVPAPEVLASNLAKASALRSDTRYGELLELLPTLLGQVTASALTASGDATAWTRVADVYGCAFAVAHRLGQADLAETVVARQAWASSRTWNPAAEAATAWNEAGVHQSAGDYADGLAIVDRAITAFERTRARGSESAIVLGSLHLRGVVLASRHRDRAATESHLNLAKSLSGQLPEDRLLHNLTFGPGNTALYELAARVELGQPDKAWEMAEPFSTQPPKGLRPNRLGRLHIDAARARLALGDHGGAEESLGAAFKVAPEMTRLHPMAREVLRVMLVAHQRARPSLSAMARRSGLR
ncbi:helix-turn-helix transcriptional regulator [Streptomyces sp. XM4193]|uniref:helix-turn-helix domain-containing protein n=1 Tax=Streptomyces sp. XM4193 TaxID=2929782 RepID=UPI001FF9475D|nr:helix-turn-helix transcriptional regulator [Streptomyces sp. XM4193]MCK1797166.1 helix-turn-helix transcriptional regulator [Streptomyces sp. XM4193]